MPISVPALIEQRTKFIFPLFPHCVKHCVKPSISGYHPGLLSGLALAGANRPTPEDDRILTAEEVATLDLSGVDLAALSACETGLGKTAGGEGLLGLQRAFHAAGARTVIASLWKVDDVATLDPGRLVKASCATGDR